MGNRRSMGRYGSPGRGREAGYSSIGIDCEIRISGMLIVLGPYHFDPCEALVCFYVMHIGFGVLVDPFFLFTLLSIASVENNRCGGNDRYGGFYAVEWDGTSK